MYGKTGAHLNLTLMCTEDDSQIPNLLKNIPLDACVTMPTSQSGHLPAWVKLSSYSNMSSARFYAIAFLSFKNPQIWKEDVGWLFAGRA